MRRYATHTGVSVDRSKAEIERVLSRYGAQQFVSGWDQDRAVIGFRAENRVIRFTLPLPSKVEFEKTPKGRRRRNQDDAFRAWEQACRQRWRALSLVIKAKLEAVASGIAMFEDEFLAYIQLPTGQTMGEWAKPQIAKAYDGKRMPAMLPGLGETS